LLIEVPNATGHFFYNQPSSIRNHQSLLITATPLSRRNALSIFGNHDVAIRTAPSPHVAGTLPGNQLDLRILEFAGKNGGKKNV